MQLERELVNVQELSEVNENNQETEKSTLYKGHELRKRAEECGVKKEFLDISLISY